MIKEEIREHLIELLEQTDFSKETPEQIVDAILWVENEEGVVIKVDRNSDDCKSCPVALVCGYVYVEPLIEEKE